MKRIVPALLASLVLATAGAGYASAATKHSMAEGSWFALSDSTYNCYVANRTAGVSEQQLAGPFKSEAAAASALGSIGACTDMVR